MNNNTEPAPTLSVHVAVIVGSTREGRYADVVTNWFVDRAAQRTDITIDIVDVGTLDLPVHFTKTRSTAITTYADRIDRADAFVVITPEYNHSYPASLKHAIDLLNAEWKRKPVGFVSYGGISGGLRAVEHLRAVFAELHTVGIRDTVSFQGPWQLFDGSGALIDPVDADVAGTTMLDDLLWWATALRAAKAADAAGAQVAA
ncbi:MAG: NADPH-dependent reductase [Acidimicrobiales bacterium]|jgi:NAD(P)H-dependent FMN reductase|nr:NADPH-dependent reductase [Acidimicrobiales bacterium]